MKRRTDHRVWAAAAVCAMALGCGDTSDAESLFMNWPAGRSADGGTFTEVPLPGLSDAGVREAGTGTLGEPPSPGQETGKGKKGDK